MFIKLKKPPQKCPYCKSISFELKGVGNFNHFNQQNREVVINKNFFCNDCKKFFAYQYWITVGLNSYKICQHNSMDRSYISFYYPKTNLFSPGIYTHFCSICGANLLCCESQKREFDTAWPDFMKFAWRKPFIYSVKPCKYCLGEKSFDLNEELSHAFPKALILLKKDNPELYDYFLGGSGSGIHQIEKKLNEMSEKYFKAKYNKLLSLIFPAKVENLRNQRRLIYKAIGDKERELNQYIRQARNYYRKKFHLPLIGEGWISEARLHTLVKHYYKELEVYFHYRPSWLHGLELDIYIPKKKTAIEYMGKQHYEPVKFFGGEKSFTKVLERDEKKKEMCKNLGINLIYFDYQTDISKNNLIKALGIN